MPILITLLLLIITSIGLFTFNYLMKRPNLAWLVLILGTAASFVSVIVWRGSLPTTVKLFSGSEFLTLLPSLLVNNTSWMVTVTLFASTLSMMITSSSSGLRRSPLFYWVMMNMFLIMSVLAVNAGNFYVSVMAFGALDVLELLTLTRSGPGSKQDHRFPIINFASQTFGLFLIVIAGLRVGFNLPYSSLEPLSSTASTLIVFGLFFRLGIFPTWLDTNDQHTLAVWHNNNHLYKFIAIAVFVSKLPVLSLNSAVSFIFQAIIAVFGVYSAWTWVTTHGAANGLRTFLIAASILATLDLIVGAQTSTLALTLIVIILTTILNQPFRHERIISIVLIGISLLSIGLPFTVSSTLWQTAHTKNFITSILAITHYMLLFGFIRHVFEDEEDNSTSSLRSLSLISMGWMAVISIILGIWGWDGAANLGVIWIYLPLFVFTIAGLVAIFRFRQVLRVFINVKMPFVGGGLAIISSSFEAIFNWIDNFLETIVGVITSITEGKGALLWTILVLLIVLLSIQGGL